MEIRFLKMQVEDDKFVKIKGDMFGVGIEIRTSLIQMAKLFSTDKEIGKELRNNLVSEDYSDSLHETKENVDKYPQIPAWDNEIELRYISVKEGRNGGMDIYGEDLIGWENEGVKIHLPGEIFDKMIGSNDFRIFMNPYRLIIDVSDKKRSKVKVGNG